MKNVATPPGVSLTIRSANARGGNRIDGSTPLAAQRNERARPPAKMPENRHEAFIEASESPPVVYDGG